MSILSAAGATVVERGIFDPQHANEALVFAAWAGSVAALYWKLAAKHQSGPTEWGLLLLGILMPSYALRYVFFGTRWGSNSSFAMVNLMFTSFCPARILLPCPDSDPLNCRLNYSKMNMRPSGMPGSSDVPDISESRASGSNSSQHASSNIVDTAYSEQKANTIGSLSPAAVWQTPLECRLSVQVNTSQDEDTHSVTGSIAAAGASEQQQGPDAENLHFPVLVPLWQIYVRERPLPIFLHTTFMTVSALLWPLQVLEARSVLLQLWKGFRQHHYALHRRLGYLALAATALGSLSAAPYAISYLTSAQVPETITGLGYLGMYTFAAWFLVTGIQAARNKDIARHQINMVRLVGLSWGVSPLGRILTITPPIIWFTGPWNNAAVVCLSWPLGILIAQKWLLKDAHNVQNR